MSNQPGQPFIRLRSQSRGDAGVADADARLDHSALAAVSHSAGRLRWCLWQVLDPYSLLSDSAADMAAPARCAPLVASARAALRRLDRHLPTQVWGYETALQGARLRLARAYVPRGWLAETAQARRTGRRPTFDPNTTFKTLLLGKQNKAVFKRNRGNQIGWALCLPQAP